MWRTARDPTLNSSSALSRQPHPGRFPGQVFGLWGEIRSSCIPSHPVRFLKVLLLSVLSVNHIFSPLLPQESSLFLSHVVPACFYVKQDKGPWRWITVPLFGMIVTLEALALPSKPLATHMQQNIGWRPRGHLPGVVQEHGFWVPSTLPPPWGPP